MNIWALKWDLSGVGLVILQMRMGSHQVGPDVLLFVWSSLNTPTNHSHTQPRSVPNLVNYFLPKRIYVKCENAILVALSYMKELDTLSHGRSN